MVFQMLYFPDHRIVVSVQLNVDDGLEPHEYTFAIGEAVVAATRGGLGLGSLGRRQDAVSYRFPPGVRPLRAVGPHSVITSRSASCLIWSWPRNDIPSSTVSGKFPRVTSAST